LDALTDSGTAAAIGYDGVGLNFAYGPGVDKQSAIALIRAAFDRQPRLLLVLNNLVRAGLAALPVARRFDPVPVQAALVCQVASNGAGRP